MYVSLQHIYMMAIFCFPHSDLAKQLHRYVSTIFWLNCILTWIYILFLQNLSQIGLW